MTFLFPLGLIALITLPVIALLHLLRERRKRVVVPSLLLWQQLPRRPDGRRTSVLPLTLLLLLHLLAAALIVLALAQPRWLGTLLGGREQLVIVVDTTTSMAANFANSTRLDAVRAEVRGLLNGMANGDSAVLITLGPQPQIVDRGGVDDRVRLLATVDALQPGGTGANLDAALTLAEAAIEEGPAARIVLFSDGSLAEQQPVPQAISALLEWRQIGDERPNRGIVTFAAQSRSSGATAAVQVYARVANYGNEPIQTWLRLYGDDKQIDERFIDLIPDSESELTWSLPAGIAVLRAELQGRDALAEDDVALLSLAQVRPLNVLLVSQSATADAQSTNQVEPLMRALTAIPGLQIAQLQAAEYAASPLAARADLTVFEGYLPTQWPAGGVLVVAPPAESALLPSGTSSEIDPSEPLRTNGGLLEGLSLGSVRFGRTRAIEPPMWAEVLLASGQQSLILRGRNGASEVAIWNFELSQTNLATRLTFPLLVARTVRDLTPQALPASLASGSSLRLLPSPRAATIELTDPLGVVQTLPVTGSLRLEGFDLPGFYSLSERTSDGRLLYNGRVAVNAGSPLESDLEIRPEPEFTLVELPRGADATPTGRELWPWFALLALLVVLGEWLYVHR